MKCHIVQENLSAYLHGELTVTEMRQMQVLNQYHESTLPLDFDLRLAKKINHLQNKKSMSFVQIISSAAAAILLTLGIQYILTETGTNPLPAHYSLFQKTKAVMVEENSWADRIIERFIERSTSIEGEK